MYSTHFPYDLCICNFRGSHVYYSKHLFLDSDLLKLINTTLIYYFYPNNIVFLSRTIQSMISVSNDIQTKIIIYLNANNRITT